MTKNDKPEPTKDERREARREKWRKSPWHPKNFFDSGFWTGLALIFGFDFLFSSLGLAPDGAVWQSWRSFEYFLGLLTVVIVCHQVIFRLRAIQSTLWLLALKSPARISITGVNAGMEQD